MRGARVHVPEQPPSHALPDNVLNHRAQEVVVSPVLHVHAGEGPQVELLEGLREPTLPGEQLQEALALLGPSEKLNVPETKRGAAARVITEGVD
eukprot:9275300-Pyramimonas_sp.AAC.1